MNKAPWIFGTIALLTTAFAYGCGNGGTTTTTGAGGATASSSHAASSSQAASTGAGTGGGLGGGGGASPMAACHSPATPPSGGSCFQKSDAGIGAGGGGTGDGGADVPCNPLTAAECNVAAGESCDFGGNDFICYGPPNDVAVCGTCDDSTTFCKVGSTCIGECTAFCCTDADCGTGGKCDQSNPTSGVGICVASP